MGETTNVLLQLKANNELSKPTNAAADDLEKLGAAAVEAEQKLDGLGNTKADDGLKKIEDAGLLSTESMRHVRNEAGRIVTGLTEADRAMGRYYTASGRMKEADQTFVAGAERAEWAIQSVSKRIDTSGLSAVEAYRLKMLEMADAFQRGGGSVLNFEADARRAAQGVAAAGAGMETAAQQVEQQMMETLQGGGAAVQQLAQDVKGSEQQISAAAAGIEQEMRTHMDGAAQATQQLPQALDQAGQQMISSSQQIGQQVGNNLMDGLHQFEQQSNNLLSQVGAGATIYGTVAGSMNQEDIAARAAGATGLGPEGMADMRDAAREVFTAGYGESFDVVMNAQVSVKGTFKDLTVDGKEMEELTRDAINIEDTFGLAPMELNRAAGVMVETGQAGSGEQAYDMLVSSFQKTPEAARDEIIDAMSEYSPFFQSIGVEGDAALGILTEFGKRGPMAVDKAGDALKEWQNRAIDYQNEAYSDAYDAVGLDHKDIADRLASGDGTAVRDTAAGLLAVEDDAKRNALAVELFGGQMEDLGTSETKNFLDALAGGTSVLGDYGNATEDLDATLDTNGRTWRELVATILTTLAAIGDALAPFLIPLLEVLTELAPALTFLAVAFTGVWTAISIGKGVLWVHGFLAGLPLVSGLASAALGVLTTAARALWGVLAAHPLVLIILAIYLLISALGWLYDNVGWVKDGFDFLSDGIKGVNDWLTNLEESIDRFIEEKLPALHKALTLGGLTDWAETQFDTSEDESFAKPLHDSEFFTGIREWLGTGEFGNSGEGFFRMFHGSDAETPADNPADEGFMNGGYTGNLPTWAVAGPVHGQEYVIPAGPTASLMAAHPGALDYIRETGQLPTREVPVPVGVSGSSGGGTAVLERPHTQNNIDVRFIVGGDVQNGRQIAEDAGEQFRSWLEDYFAERERRDY